MQTPFARPPATPRLTEARATALFLRVPKVAHWLRRYPSSGRVTAATFDPKTGSWTVGVWSGKAGEVAMGKVDDQDASVTAAWTGPQVAWKMARGVPGAFGGKRINSLPVWLAFCAVFLVGLIDWRRVLSLRTLDLLVLLSFSVSLWFFNRGDIFTSVPLVYPPLLYLIGRAVWIGLRGRATTTRATLPVWLLLGAAVFLAGFRIGLNAEASNVIDVGYAGVIGAARIVHGQAPYGHMPAEGVLKACGPADAEGEIRERIQANGRCETANERGDTYGPVAYLAYIPGYLVRGWTGKWDDLPAAHITSGLFDLLCLAGMFFVGMRYGGRELGAVLALAWASYPFTQYASNSNTNDLIPPAFLIWGLWAAGRPWARGALVALSSLDEVLLADRGPALAHLPRAEGPPGSGIRRRLRRRDGSRVLDPPPRAESVARGARLLGPDARLADRARVAVLDLGLAAVPRGVARPARAAVGVERRAGRGRDRVRPRTPPQVAAPARRPHRGAALRLRARPHALVLSLPALGLPVPRVRLPRAGLGGA